MNSHLIISFAVACTGLICVSCADNADGDPWGVEEPPPESTINQALCTDMPGADLDAPVVEDLGEQQWRVRYPVFEQGCGVYQADAYLGLGPEGEIRTEEYEPRVCNRCDQAQQVVFLEGGDGYGVEQSPEQIPVPQQPSVTEVPALYNYGLPVVRTGERDGGCALDSPTGEVGSFYPSYSYVNLHRVDLASGARTETHRVPGLEDTGLTGALSKVAQSAGAAERLRIYWPRMHHRDVAVTGLDAASAYEFCEQSVYHGETFYDRPYDEPYRLDDKYVRQNTAAPTLPDDLREQLLRQVDDAQP